MRIYTYNGKRNSCGEQVRRLRTELGITQTELAARLQLCGMEIDQKSVSRIELQERFVSDFELWALSLVLNVKVADLMQDLPAVELPEYLQKKRKN